MDFHLIPVSCSPSLLLQFHPLNPLLPLLFLLCGFFNLPRKLTNPVSGHPRKREFWRQGYYKSWSEKNANSMNGVLWGWSNFSPVLMGPYPSGRHPSKACLVSCHLTSLAAHLVARCEAWVSRVPSCRVSRHVDCLKGPKDFQGPQLWGSSPGRLPWSWDSIWFSENFKIWGFCS